MIANTVCRSPRSWLKGRIEQWRQRLFASELLHKMDAYWRAANYLSVGQIYLYDNPLLREPLKLSGM